MTLSHLSNNETNVNAECLRIRIAEKRTHKLSTGFQKIKRLFLLINSIEKRVKQDSSRLLSSSTDSVWFTLNVEMRCYFT